MFEKFRKEKAEPEAFKGKEGESILHVIEKPEIVIHKAGWVKGLGIAATVVGAGAGMHDRVGATAFGAEGVGGILGGTRRTGPVSHRRNISNVNQQSDRIFAEKLIITDKRILAVIDGANVTLEACYDKEFFRQMLLGQKKRNTSIEEANRPKPDDKDNKYKQRTGVEIHNSLPRQLRGLGYVDNTYALADIELRKGILGDLTAWTFYIEIARISTPLVMKDSEGGWGRLMGRSRAIAFSNEINESVELAKCDIKVKEDKKQHIDNQQVMAEFTQSVQAKIKELREYAFRKEGDKLLITSALRADFEA
ncbi:MAG: hypothetical protein KGH71_04410 [Candidatus Micrarchaeota archaeon]|nr:hypothetical protein [Candidatus Micrarchaeota archaeon]